ncbi:MAG: hypothetical protein WEB06_18960 [Actinomycetota bacterium]
MREDPLAMILAGMDHPIEPRVEFAERLLDRLEGELRPDPRAIPSSTPRRRWRGARRLVPAFTVLVGLVVGALVVFPRPPSALAVLQEARHRFAALPPFHATVLSLYDESASSPDYEVEVLREDWYRSDAAWRSKILRTNSTPFGVTGSFDVSDGALVGRYNPRSNIFSVRPLAEVGSAVRSSPAAPFDPALQWWPEATGDEGKPSDAFFEENCHATSVRFLGRGARKLICPVRPTQPRDIELWVDDETGMLVKVVTFEVVHEIRSIEFDPNFAEGLFEVVPPAGARKRWVGEGPPAPGYEIVLGTEIAARIPIGETDGFTVAAGESALWLVNWIPTTPPAPYATEIIRIDPASGRIVARIPAPESDLQIVSVLERSGFLWVAFDREEGSRASRMLQRLDVSTNVFVDPRLDLGEGFGGMTLADGVLWTAAGVGRDVTSGRAQLRYGSLSRVDPETFEVSRYPLDGAPMDLAFQAGSLWISLGKVNDTDRFDDDHAIARVDPAMRKVQTEIAVPHGPSGLLAAAGFMWTIMGEPWTLVRIDPATNARAKVPTGNGGGEVAYDGRFIWATSSDDDEVVKIDPATLKVVARIRTGRGPGSVAAGFGSVWVANGIDGTLARIDVP